MVHVGGGVCANCGAHLHGEFCHECGQRRLGEDALSPAPFIRQFAVELARVDSKTIRSLIALLRPGYLAASFIDGHRISYLGPLKMYFLAAAIFFLAAPLAGSFNLRQMLSQDDGTLRAAIEARMAETQMPYEEFERRFDVRLTTVYTFSPIVSAAAVAFVLWLLYRCTVPRIGAHVVFALYFTAFFYLAALVANAIYTLRAERQPLIFALLLYALMAPYAYIALQRVYGAPPRTTLWKTTVLFVLTFLLDIPVNIAARAITIALT